MKVSGSILALFMLAATGSIVRAQPDVGLTVPACHPIASMGSAEGANPRAGSGTSAPDVQGSNSPCNEWIFQAAAKGVLSFTTGHFVNSLGPGDWRFGAEPADDVAMTRAAPGAGISSSTTFLQGTGLSATATASPETFKKAFAAFRDTPNSALANAYGLPTQGNGNAKAGSAASGTAAKNSRPTRSSSGSALSTAVPAPSFLVLLCSGVGVGLIGYVLRRRKASTAGVS